MGKKDPRVDAYLAKSADFARPVLARIRQWVHTACPQVEETIKWGVPFFLHTGNLCSMVALKQRCAFGFWHPSMRDKFTADDKPAVARFRELTSLADLPKSADFKRYVKMAMLLNESGEKPAIVRKKKPKPKLVVPGDLSAALKKNRKAANTFDQFSYSNRKEYIEWLTDAKRAGTRAKRLAAAIAWLAEGKPRHWKYR